MISKLSFNKLYVDMHGKVVRVVEGRVNKSGVITVNKFGTVLFEGVGNFPRSDFIANNAGILRNFLKRKRD